MESKDFVVGINLGTRHSSCHYCNIQTEEYGCLTFINNNKTIPSVVNFNNTPVIVGVPYENAVCETKRFIGLKYNDPKVKEMIDKKVFPFEVIEGEEGYAAIKVYTKKTGKEEIFTPEMISAMILREIHFELRRKFNLKKDDVIKAVISVPAYFTEQQKDATKAAAMMSGFELLEMIYEPTCALKAYDLEKHKPGYYLALDLGGGTFDLTIMKKDQEGNNIKPVFIDGDSYLGGIDFDINFMNFVIEEINKKDESLGKMFIHSVRDASKVREQKKRRLYKLRKMVEQAKIELSSELKTQIDISDFVGEEEGTYVFEFSREDFEKCNMDLFEKIIKTTYEGVQSKNIKKSEIREIILFGGSSRIPIITTFLKQAFPEVHINNHIDGDLIVSLGACQYARKKVLEGLTGISEVLVHSICLKNYNEDNTTFTLHPIIEAGTPLPIEGVQYPFITDQVEAYMELVEDGRDLGVFTIKNIPPSARNQVQFFVVKVDSDGMIHVSGEINGKPVECEASIPKKSENQSPINRSKEFIDSFFN